MRNRFSQLRPVLGYVGTVLMVFSAIIVLPILVLVFNYATDQGQVPPNAFIIPAALSFAVGFLLHRFGKGRALNASQSMLVMVIGWIAVPAIGAMPYWLMHVGKDVAAARQLVRMADPLHISYLDAYFESMSGFTTTGMTLFAGLDHYPRSILFWRSLTEWVGGLGILSFFILVLFSAGEAHTLYGAESTKIFSRRPVPGVLNTVKVLWMIYAAFTAAGFIAFWAEGVGAFDAASLALTTVSTGGFANYDANAGYYAGHAALYPHYRVVEYTIIIGMLAGSVSFLVHYRLFRGNVSALWNTSEMRMWWYVLAASTVLVAYDVTSQGHLKSAADVEEKFRAALFQATSMFTTSGFNTKDISNQGVFASLSRQVFLILMVIGAAGGSTASGVKLFRVVLLGKAASRELHAIVSPHRAVKPFVLDGEIIEADEVIRTAGIVFAWLAVVAAGGIVTAIFSEQGALESLSAMASATFNVGPCFIGNAALLHLHPVLKVTYVIGMLAGRLEILPVLLLFNRRAWM